MAHRALCRRVVFEERGHVGFEDDFGGRRCSRRARECGACVRAILSGQSLWLRRLRLRGGYGGYGNNSQLAVGQCTAAVTQRLNRDQGGHGGYSDGYGSYGGYGGYGGGYGNARVLGISRVEPSASGGVTIRGVASSGFNAGYGGYGNGGTPDLTFSCRTDYRGFVVDVDIDPAQRNYGNGYQQPYDNPYSVYGYRRY